MPDQMKPKRVFLLLQGPHGPFFSKLGNMLRQAGCEVWRVGFNAGDAAFWRDGAHYIPFQNSLDQWPNRFNSIINDKGVTDIVIYGDTRQVHAIAAEQARERGLTVHVFEEGYLRPYWISYERDGSNGHSALMQTSLTDVRGQMTQRDMAIPEAPGLWGSLRRHMFYGALYHGFILFFNQGYKAYRPHRSLSVAAEFRLHLLRFLLLPLHAAERFVETTRVKMGGFPYHVVLLQLEHDASFQEHSPFSTMSEFLEIVTRGFAESAPKHHRLVFKAHPLEDGRVPLRKMIRAMARDHGITSRVHYIRGGKLARLLDHARTAITVNSTAGQQVLWRGIPLKLFGRAIYDKPELVSDQPLPEFFVHPQRSDNEAYALFRRYLLETSQIPGSFYSAAGRRQVLRQVVDMMLSPHDPYTLLKLGRPAPREYLRMLPQKPR
ncbi:capsule biosynthesis protein [Pseudaestuariivita rosea]|uniref:capsule biosynthesis protein n=1 Tax=Pseudaestuariivita rosea TaxID=2763263 RepID=UPI001F1C1C0A|nr:capsule biosynthesis protein CapA [Pseudaestuariivita rosea]